MLSDDGDMTLGLYEWATGDCFRCALTGVDTTHLGEINTPLGCRYEVRGCRDCVLYMECEQRRLAERRGGEYYPGRLGS